MVVKRLLNVKRSQVTQRNIFYKKQVRIIFFEQPFGKGYIFENKDSGIIFLSDVFDYKKVKNEAFKGGVDVWHQNSNPFHLEFLGFS